MQRTETTTVTGKGEVYRNVRTGESVTFGSRRSIPFMRVEQRESRVEDSSSRAKSLRRS